MIDDEQFYKKMCTTKAKSKYRKTQKIKTLDK